MLYGLPPSSTCLARLNHIRQSLRPKSISFLVDHPAQLKRLANNGSNQHEPTSIFVKLDIGDHRAGVPHDHLLQFLEELKNRRPHLELEGFYVYMGNSYGSDNSEDAVKYLTHELRAARDAAHEALDATPSPERNRLTLSVGASPTARAAQNLGKVGQSSLEQELSKVLDNIRDYFFIELHAGVYPLLDLQQIATHAVASSAEDITHTRRIGLTVLAEILSVYENRPSAGAKHEALMGAGTLALGREPCKSYDGWGVVVPSSVRSWHDKTPAGIQHITSVDKDYEGWTVNRISQEHGMLGWQGSENLFYPLQVGEKVEVWCNHACIAGAGFGWYLVVDSSLDHTEKVVRDVWVRCRGW